MTKIFHQLGHRYQWSLDSISESKTGDGVIIGPRYIEMSDVQSLPDNIRKNAIFDPQFYIPQSYQGKLNTYHFFPQVIADGFSTNGWNDDLSLRCAEECLNFQQECDFSYLTIPSRFYEGMPSEFIDNLDNQFARPFLEAASKIHNRKPILLQIIVTNQMIRDEHFRNDLLNWLTSFPDVSGIYLIYHIHNRRKQIDDIGFLFGLLCFCSALKNAGLQVITGYCNTEAILLLCANVDAVTMGIYENLRMFNVRAFEERGDSVIRGPHARVYIPRLLQWVNHFYVDAIRLEVKNIDDYIDDNNYRVAMFSPTYNWHFTKPDPYKHYFVVFSQQLRRLSLCEGVDRLDAIIKECNNARREFSYLEHSGIEFDTDSDSSHIPHWMTAINQWRKI